ncbi:MAG: hypothetical protein L3J82_05790 [Planctomycetes bacterium]|nr:hypothetical protein [Planctomycetota bacterium]
MLKHEVDLKRDMFKVVYDPKLTSTDDMLAVIKKEGFKGKVVERTDDIEEVKAVTIDLATVGKKLKTIFDKAAAEGKLVLVDIHGPG